VSSVRHTVSEMTMEQIRERIERQRNQLYVILMQPTEQLCCLSSASGLRGLGLPRIL
jgi:hypothetical protein